MFSVFQEEQLITIGIFSFWGLSVFIRILLGILYNRMIKEADNMPTTTNKMLKQCKLKFANCYQLNNGVANIPIFVDKFLNRMMLGPFSFETMYRLSAQFMLFSVVCSGIGICKSITIGKRLEDILPFYIISFLGLYLYFSISSMIDLKGKKRILKVNLVDYLENHLAARMEITEKDLKKLYGEKKQGKKSEKQVKNGQEYGKRTVELVSLGNRQVVKKGKGVMEDSIEEIDEEARYTRIRQRNNKEDFIEQDMTEEGSEDIPDRSSVQREKIEKEENEDRNLQETFRQTAFERFSEEELEDLLKAFLTV